MVFGSSLGIENANSTFVWGFGVILMFLLCTALYCFTLPEWDDKEEGKDVTQQWEDDWDDDDVSDDFSLQLRRELESNTDKN